MFSGHRQDQMKTDINVDSSRNTSVPFVGNIMPSVCHNYRALLPYIGIYRPSIFYIIKNKGFTLTELVVTVTIVGILSALAAPNFIEMVRDNRLTGITNELIGDMLLSRTEAIKRNNPVVICKTNDASVADPVCDTTNSSPWSKGWIVFVDTNNSGTRDSPGGTLETLLRVHGSIESSSISLTPLAPTGTDSDMRNFVSYRPSGRPLSFTGGTFKLCDQRGARSAKSLVVSETGQARISYQRDSSGPLQDHKGVAITCP